jgi:hypothetical protein
MVGLLLLLPCPRGQAQTTTTFFLPEVDAYIRLASNVRLELQGKAAIQDGSFYRATLGPSLTFNLKPLKKLKDIAFRSGRYEVHARDALDRISLPAIGHRPCYESL